MNYRNLMKESIAYLIQSGKRQVEIRELAERCAVSPGYFGYLFSSFFLVPLAKLVENTDVLDCFSTPMPFEREVKSSALKMERRRFGSFSIVGRRVEIPQGQEESIFERTEQLLLGKGAFPASPSGQDGVYAACWYHDGQYNFHYLAGAALTDPPTSGEDLESLSMPPSEYLLVSMGREEEIPTAEAMKEMLKYALSQEGEAVRDETRCPLFCSRGGRIFLCLPLAPEKERKKSFYDPETWTEYIDRHIMEKISIQEIADEFGYSPTQFRRLFILYYGISVSDYMRKRRIWLAAKAVREEKSSYESIARKYGFQTYQGFSKAFRKEFRTTPKKYRKVRFEAISLNRYYLENIGYLKISYIDIGEIRMIGRTVIPDRGQDVDIPAQVSYWMEQEFPSFKGARFPSGKSGGRDLIAMWYHDERQSGDEINIEYILGPVVDRFSDDIPGDMVKVTIAGGHYAIFETDRESDTGDMAETIRMFSRCVFYGWIKEHREMVEYMGFTFERYINGKAYIYVPMKRLP